MIFKTGDIWSTQAQVICITTNGFVKKSGEAIMGKGIALEAKQRCPGIERKLGDYLNRFGNRPFNLGTYSGKTIVSFPTKERGMELKQPEDIDKVVSYMQGKFLRGDFVPGWAMKSSLELIERSARHLLAMMETHNWSSVAMTKPGCGNGELNWHEVMKVLPFDDRFEIWSLR